MFYEMFSVPMSLSPSLIKRSAEEKRAGDQGPCPSIRSTSRNKFGTRSESLKVGGQFCVIAVPIFHGSIFGLQEAEKAAVRAVSERVAPHFDRVARFHIVTRDSNILELRATGGFQSPHLRLARGVLDFQVDPGMRENQVKFLNHTLDIKKRLGDVVPVGVMCPRR